MKILDEFTTVQWLIKHRGSIARYGDGELKLCMGRSAKSQSPNPDMQKRLRDILQKPLFNCLVGIPRIYNRDDWPTKEKQSFWNRYSGNQFTALYNPKIQYGSAFITRPDTNSKLDSVEYFDLIKQLWKDRSVFLYQGARTRFNKTGTFFDTAISSRTYIGPATDAFTHYLEILDFIIDSTSDDDVIVLALGPTATVLAYDLTQAGRQALDLGHLGQFYAHIHPKSSGNNEKYYERG